MFRTLLLLLITAAVPGSWHNSHCPVTPLHRSSRKWSRLVRENYVFADKVDGIVASLEKKLADGRYAVTDPQQLATRLTEDVQAVTSDKHMNVKFNPEQAAGLRGPRVAGNDAFRQQQMVSANYGVLEMRVLPGNVRYVNISPAFFWDPSNSPRAWDDAMRFLGGGDAYILDIRTNGGGSPATVRYIVSHFMDPGQKLMTYHMGPTRTSESRTGEVPAGKLPAKPLYLLTAPAERVGGRGVRVAYQELQTGKAGRRDDGRRRPSQRALRHTRGIRDQCLGRDGDPPGDEYRLGGNGRRPRPRGAGRRRAGRSACRCVEGIVAKASGPQKVELQKALDGLAYQAAALGADGIVLETRSSGLPVKILNIPTTTHGKILVREAEHPSAVVVGFHGYMESATIQMDRLLTLPGSNAGRSSPSRACTASTKAEARTSSPAG